MSCRKWHSRFGKAPLTYETLTARANNFHAQRRHSPADLQDYIYANRKLQSINWNLDPSIRNKTPGVDLGIVLYVPGKQLEDDLWSFLCKYWASATASDDVVKAYISTNRSNDMSTSFELVKANFRESFQLKNHACFGPVTALVHVLLRRNDFSGCFKLVDETVNSAEYVAHRRNVVFSGLFKTGSVSLAFASLIPVLSTATIGADITSISAFLGQVRNNWPIIPITLTSGFGIFYALKSIRVGNLSRVSWRPHTSLLHRILHQEEASYVNKIVTYFEEYNETNVKNFHISEVRSRASLDIFDHNNHELQSPEASNFGSIQNIDDAAASMARQFRSELYSRKLVWRPLKEEQMFLDFWMNHGDSYEWAEPDQDPAEIAILRPSTNKAVVPYQISRPVNYESERIASPLSAK